MRSHDLGIRDGRRATIAGGPGRFLGSNRPRTCLTIALYRSRTFPPSRFRFSFLMEPGESPT